MGYLDVKSYLCLSVSQIIPEAPFQMLFKNSRKYLQRKVHLDFNDIGCKLITCILDPGGKLITGVVEMEVNFIFKLKVDHCQ